MKTTTLVPGAFHRKRYGEGWLVLFVVIGFFLSFSGVLGLVDNNKNDIPVVGSEDVDGRDNMFNEDSIRLLRRLPETKSKTVRDRIEIPKYSERKDMDFGTGGVGRKTLNHGTDELYNGEWGKDLEFFERVKHNRRLQNDTNETGQDKGPSTNATFNTTVDTEMTEDDVEVIISKAVFGVTIALGTIAILLSIVSWVFVYLHRNNSLVAIGQPPFLYLICFGSILLSSELFFLFRYNDSTENDEFEDQSTSSDTCIAQLWLQNIGSVCVHMAIFCKLWRAYKVTQFRKNQKILPKHVIGPFVGMLVAVIALTITQTILDPPVWQVRELNVGSCMSSYHIALSDSETDTDTDDFNGKSYIWIEITTFCLFFLILLVMLCMAYVARKIPEHISDSRRVFYTVFTGLSVSVTMYGISWIGIWANRFGLMVVSSSLRYFFDAIIYVGFLVVPKLYAVWCEHQQSRKAQQALEGNIGKPTTTSTSAEGNHGSPTVTTPPKSKAGGRVFVSGLNPASSS